MTEIVNLDSCPYSSTLNSYIGMFAGIALSAIGSAYGTAKAGKGVISAGIIKPSQAMKNTLPVIMAGVLGIYGLIIAIVINSQMVQFEGNLVMPLYTSQSHLAAGMSTGLAAFAAGLAIGVAGSSGARANAKNQKLFVVMLLILVFGEALALYGLIMGLILCFKDMESETCRLV